MQRHSPSDNEQVNTSKEELLGQNSSLWLEN